MKSYMEITSKYLKIQKKRTILTIIGIILSVALITGIGTIILSMRDKMIRDAVKETGDYHVQFTGVPGSSVDKITKHVETENSAVTINQGYAVISKTDENEQIEDDERPPYRYFSVYGFSTDALNMLPITLSEGRMPEAPGEIIVDNWTLEYLGEKPKVGDRIRLDIGVRKEADTGNLMENLQWNSGTASWSKDEIFEKTSEKEYTVVGLIKPRFFSSSNCFASAISFIDGKNLAAGENYNVYAKLKSINNVMERSRDIAKDAGLTAQSVHPNENLLRLSAQSLNGSLNNSMKIILAFIVGLVIISTVAVIYNAFHISVLERVSQFGILRCVGASPSQIKRIVLKEALTLSVIGIPPGLLCGIAAMKVVFYISGLLDSIYFGDMHVVVSVPILAASAVLGLLTVYLSAYGPARQAANVSPLDAVRNSGGFKKEKFKRIRKSRLARLFFGIEGQIAWKNLRRNRKRFAITVFSMVISIVLFITFGSLVDYTYKVGAVDNSEMGDFSFWKNGSSFTEAEYNEVRELKGVQTVFKYNNVYTGILVPEAKINPRFRELRGELLQDKKGDSVLLPNSEILCYGDSGLGELKRFLKAGDIDVDSLNGENGVILVGTDQLYDNSRNKTVFVDVANFRVGDSIQITTGDITSDSGAVSFKTVKVKAILEKGILGEVYNQNGGIYLITTEKVFKSLTGNSDYKRMYIKLAKNADNKQVSGYFKDLTENKPEYGYMDYAEAAKEYRNQMIIISIFLYGFIAVITLIGCLNIINTISTNLILRTRELSMFKAVGMTEYGIKKMVYLESIFYGLIAALYGGVVGTFMAYILYKLVNGIREFQWTIPWQHIIIAVLGAAFVAVLSGYVPLKRINRGVIVENIRMEE